MLGKIGLLRHCFSAASRFDCMDKLNLRPTLTLIENRLFRSAIAFDVDSRCPLALNMENGHLENNMLMQALRNVQGEYATHFVQEIPIICKVHEHFGKKPKRKRDAGGEREGAK